MMAALKNYYDRWLLAIALVWCGAQVLAQYAVNRPAVGQVNTQVNNEIYGRSIPMNASIHGYTPAATSMAMGSEVRYAYSVSGATPSSVRSSYSSIGPRATGGRLSYIPAAPDYMPGRSDYSAPPPPMGAAAYSSSSSVRYSTPRSPGDFNKPLPPLELSSALVSPAPLNSGPMTTGTIRTLP